MDLQPHYMDDKTKFLNDRLEEEMYMEQPRFFVHKNQDNLVYNLPKLVYGFKQYSK